MISSERAEWWTDLSYKRFSRSKVPWQITRFESCAFHLRNVNKEASS
jgi:hypothetical protein